MLDKAAVLEIVEDKLDERKGKFDFLSRDYLEILIKIIVESIHESCDECRMNKRGEN